MPQEQEQPLTWPQEMQDNDLMAGVGMGEDDFTKFLDLENDLMQFDNLDSGPSGLDTPMGRLGFGQSAPMQFSDNTYGGQQMHLGMPSVTTPNMQPSYGNIPVNNILPSQTQAFDFQHYRQVPISSGYQIPPTPVSSEMHAAKYGQRLDNAGHIMYDGSQVRTRSSVENPAD